MIQTCCGSATATPGRIALATPGRIALTRCEMARLASARRRVRLPLAHCSHIFDQLRLSYAEHWWQRASAPRPLHTHAPEAPFCASPSHGPPDVGAYSAVFG